MNTQQHDRAKKRRRRKRNSSGDGGGSGSGGGNGQPQRQPQPKKHAGFPVTFCGRTFYILPPDRTGIRQMEQFIIQNRLSPLDIAKRKLDGLTPPQQEALLRDALYRESTIPNYVSQHEFAAACDTHEGRAMLMWLMTRKTHPEMTRESIQDMFEQATEDEFEKLLADWDGMVKEE